MPARRKPGAPLRVTLDATPLLGVRTGIGRYVEHLIAELGRRADLEVRATAFTLRGWRALAAALPTGVTAANRPVPARVLRRLWTRSDLPPVEWICGRTDVFHGTNFVLPPARRAAGVLTLHDLSFITHPETMHEKSTDLSVLVPRGLARAKVVTTLAETTRQAISERFAVPLRRILVASPGVDRQWFEARPPDASLRSESGLPADYFLFIGTREPRKGLTTLIEAYARVRAELGPAVPELVLIGASGWGPDQLGPATTGVHVLGYVPQSDLVRVAAGARALVLPSLDEGFGMPAIEGLAAGCPVVVSDIPVLREVTGGAALTFAMGDAGSLTRSLRSVLDGHTPDLATRLAQAGRYTWAACAEVTAQAYRLAAGGPDDGG